MVLVPRQHGRVALLFDKFKRTRAVQALLEPGRVVDVGLAHDGKKRAQEKEGGGWKSACLRGTRAVNRSMTSTSQTPGYHGAVLLRCDAYSNVAFTSSAENGLPSWNFTPSR